MRRSSSQAHLELAVRLRGRWEEIEEAILTRARVIADPAEVVDPTYAEGLRLAVSAALDYGLHPVEHPADRLPPVPPHLLAQARLAARNGVSLDTVLRRYFAGYAVLGDYLLEASGELGSANLQRLLRAQAALLDGVVSAVSEEYAREAASRSQSADRHRAERVRRLLGGESLDSPETLASELAYGFEGFHTAAVGFGANAGPAIRSLASSLGARLLLVSPATDTVWAWLGRRSPLSPTELHSLCDADPPSRAVLALGEPGEGLAGWRLSHRQAAAAAPLALRSGEGLIRYRDVAILASALRDELLASTLRCHYLDPLCAERDEGVMAKETLRAYFAANRNVASAAAALGVSRQAAAKRLRGVEARLERSLGSCAQQLEVALQLESLYREGSMPIDDSQARPAHS